MLQAVANVTDGIRNDGLRPRCGKSRGGIKFAPPGYSYFDVGRSAVDPQPVWLKCRRAQVTVGLTFICAYWPQYAPVPGAALKALAQYRDSPRQSSSLHPRSACNLYLAQSCITLCAYRVLKTIQTCTTPERDDKDKTEYWRAFQRHCALQPAAALVLARAAIPGSAALSPPRCRWS